MRALPLATSKSTIYGPFGSGHPPLASIRFGEAPSFNIKPHNFAVTGNASSRNSPHQKQKVVLMSEIPQSKPDNIFLSGSIPFLFVKTAIPITIVMLVNGLHTVVDAYFLGKYVGTQALTGVTLMFPLFMVLVALFTLVSNGFASIYARALGANNQRTAKKMIDSSIFLALIVCAVLILFFVTLGFQLALFLTNGTPELAEIGYQYMAILIIGSPLGFILSINIDRLRCEGLLPLMTAVTLSGASLNIFFDWLFVAQFGWGVPGSAYGTLTAQLLSLTALVAYYTLKHRHFSFFKWRPVRFQWNSLLALGIPSSLGYIGVSLMAATVLYAIQLWAGTNYEATAGAYGIVTRVTTLTFLPLLGLSMAFQSIVGNNYGAQNHERTASSIKTAILIALVYCSVVQALYFMFSDQLGFIFVDDTATIAEVARITPIITMVFFLFGPLMITGTFYQAIGDAQRATILLLSRTYLFAIPLTFLLPFFMGEVGIWYSGVIAEFLLLGLTLIVLAAKRKTVPATQIEAA
ncbi:Multidrug export protein MepA [Pseudovibrio axinellae]|uniref:Multidrug export protein MepA n=1 Tax=Pseudovibrio axinellae TaxID=989403 RepID=A0A166A580_9HYPH|nr:MATE family efflux transporter [Pseudovibrio axinellae]KZL20635.1 Multidrug export protein MepA [Pseudovibrio axinellae]SER27277.1 putative efflux protein, MATE family [Pseudovibrio axinellae]